MVEKKVAEIALFRPLENLFEYRIPEDLSGEIERGSICKAPLAGGQEKGIVYRLKERKEFEGELQSVKEVLFPDPLGDEQFELASWISDRTLTPIGQIFADMVPNELDGVGGRSSSVRLNRSFSQTKKAIERFGKKAPKQKEALKYLLSVDGTVTKKAIREEVECSYSPLNALIEKGFLKEVSGKAGIPPIPESPSTSPDASPPEPGNEGFEVSTLTANREKRLSFYSEIAEGLDREGTLLFTVPTIYEAELTRAWFERNSTTSVRAYHSRLKRGEISEVWEEAFYGQLDILIGLRKAILAPLTGIEGVIVESEGHRNYRPSGQRPRLDVLEVARKIARIYHTPLYLGGGVPSLKTFYMKSREESVSYTEVESFPHQDKEIEVIESTGTEEEGTMSTPLKRKLDKCFSRGERAVLVGERRGDYSAIACGNCGEVLRCSDCGVPFVYYREGSFARCNYCGKTLHPGSCPSCGGREWDYLGGGVDKIASEVEEIWPEIRIGRILSTRLSIKDYFSIVKGFISGDIDLVVGTRAVSSILVLQGVSIVGVVGLDGTLSRPDYRSAELLTIDLYRMLDLIDEGGSLLVQTAKPGNEIFRTLRSGKWDDLYREELKSRKQFDYPPYSKLVKVVLRGGEGEENYLPGDEVAAKLREEGRWSVLGPKGDYPPKLRDKRRWVIMVKTDSVPALVSALREATEGERGLEVLVEAEY